MLKFSSIQAIMTMSRYVTIIGISTIHSLKVVLVIGLQLDAFYTQGKGTEDVSRYAGCKLVHLDIPNIHTVRESLDQLKVVCNSPANSKWLSSLENTQWLFFISLILKVCVHV